MTAEDRVVDDYIKARAALEKFDLATGKDRPRPDGFVYAGMCDFLQQHGRFWTPQDRPRGFRQMTAKYCFDNAYRTLTDARHKRRDLRYVEGIALSQFFPVHHAWIVDELGRVIDQTWDTPGTSYFGVVFRQAEIFAVRNAQSVSILDNWAGPHRHAIYRQRFKENA
jgi:hypothetical protein